MNCWKQWWPVANCCPQTIHPWHGKWRRARDVYSADWQRTLKGKSRSRRTRYYHDLNLCSKKKLDSEPTAEAKFKNKWYQVEPWTPSSDIDVICPSIQHCERRSKSLSAIFFVSKHPQPFINQYFCYEKHIIKYYKVRKYEISLPVEVSWKTGTFEQTAIEWSNCLHYWKIVSFHQLISI